MTEPTTGEQKTTDKTKLSEAVRIVQEAISAEENRLKQVGSLFRCFQMKALPEQALKTVMVLTR